MAQFLSSAFSNSTSGIDLCNNESQIFLQTTGALHSSICITLYVREIARMLADDYKKRVVIVDTSNEIAGDGDIPHIGIGGARRMQVPNVDMQHKVFFIFMLVP
eukprot:Gb_33352 [translate_table: standard]